MRRPLALTGFTLLCSNLLCLLLGNTFAVVAILVSFVTLLLFFLIKSNNSRLVSSLRGCCFLFLCGCLCFLLQFYIQVQPLLTLNNTKQYVTFTVTQEQGIYENCAYYTVKAKGVYPNDENKHCKMRLSAPAAYPLEIGDRVSAIVSLSGNPHPSLMAQDIYLTAQYEEESSPHVLGKSHTFSYYAHKARTALRDAMNQMGNNDSSVLISGICLGDSQEMSPQLQRDFYGVGLGHLVAVSGLHTAQIGGVFITLFFMITRRKRWVKLCSLLFVWGFVFLTGASYSSLRAAIMFSFFAVGSFLFRQMDSLNTLGGAITVIVLVHPFSIGSIGFLASVFACAGLIILATPLSERVTAHLPLRWQSNKGITHLVQGICATCSALLFTIPCNFLGFYTLSPVAPLSNLICVPLATGILICGLLGSVLCFIPPLSVLGLLILWIAKGLATVIATVAELLAKIPYHSLPQATPLSFIAIVLLAVACVSFWFYPKAMRTVAKSLVFILLCAGIVTSSFLPAFPPQTEEFCFLANSYDSALAIVSGNTTLYIGNCMTYQLEQYLGSRGIRDIDLWILPQREQYTQTLTQIPQKFSINKVMTFFNASTMGLLAGVPTQTPRHYGNTAQVGNITVTALENFHAFEIATANTTLYYGDGTTTTKPTVPFTFLNRQRTKEAQHTLSYQHTHCYVNQTTVVRISPNKHRIYQPIYWY